MLHIHVAGNRPTVRRRMLATLCFLLAVILISFEVNEWTGPLVGPSARNLVIGLGFIGLGIGVETARDWSRWCCGILGVVFGSLFVVVTVQYFGEALGRSWWDLLPLAVLWILLCPALCITVAVYCFLPSTRKHFAEARTH